MLYRAASVLARISRVLRSELRYGPISTFSERGVFISLHRYDVTQEQSVLDARAEAERNFGKLHIACNNAGVPMQGTRLTNVQLEDWEFVIGVNIWGVIHGIRHLVPAILRHGEEGHA